MPFVEKPEIYIVSGSSDHLNAIGKVLASFYTNRLFNDREELDKAISTTIPKAFIIDEYFPSGKSGLSVLDHIRKTEHLNNVPVVFLARVGAYNQVETANKKFYVKVVLKPYRATQLINSVSEMSNSSIEIEWKSLGTVQKVALQNTLHSFNSIADLIADGKPLPIEDVQDSCTHLVSTIQDGTFKDLLHGVRGHDNYTYVHSLRVAVFLSLFGDYMGMNSDETKILATGGILHDVGKMLIPHKVLNKPGKLTEEEMEVMRGHVNGSIDFLDKTPDIPRGVKIIAAQHHEKLDGTGYPFGLKGNQLNELARMSAIVDIFSALTDRRVYKEPMPPEQAIKIMESMTSHIDLHFLKSFKELLLDATLDDNKNPHLEILD